MLNPSRVSRPAVLALALVLAFSNVNSASAQPPPSCPDASPVHALSHCGTERWAAKTLSDNKTGSINFDQVNSITLTEVNQKTGHCHPGMSLRRTFTEELQVFEVTGWVRCVKREQDRDYHIAIFEEDAADAPSMVVEVIDPGCNGSKISPEHQRLVDARSALMQVSNSHPHSLVSKRIKVTGVGFFDREHTPVQIGASSSCMELHPVLSIELAP